jgi:hypothetical protein
VLNTGQDRKLAKIQSHIFRKISTSLESRPLYDHDAIVFEQMRWVLGALDVGQDFRKYKNNNNNNKRKSARANFSEQRNKALFAAFLAFSSRKSKFRCASHRKWRLRNRCPEESVTRQDFSWSCSSTKQINVVTLSYDTIPRQTKRFALRGT